MKQLLIVTNNNFGTAETEGNAGVITMRKLSNQAILSAKAEENFMISLGRGKSLVPFIIPEVDVNTLKVTKTTPTEAVAFTGDIDIPEDIEVGADYTVIFSKVGTVFNERNKWTVTYRPIKGDTAATVANKFNNFINNNGTLGLKSNVSGAKVTVTSDDVAQLYTITAADSLSQDAVTVAEETEFGKATGDAAYVRDLAQRCVAGKGIKYLGEDGSEIYPGYPENVPDGTYNIYTLRFAVGRDSAKQRDERVSQLVHIAVPTSANTVINKIETILGVTIV